MAYLRREGQYHQAKRPEHAAQGWAGSLSEIKPDPALQHIPVVILTTSSADQDVIKTYDPGANAYVVKPVHLDQLVTIVQKIEEFWFTVVKLPQK